MQKKAGTEGKRKGFWFFILMVLAGALIGAVISEIVGHFAQSGWVHRVFVSGISAGFEKPVELNLLLVHLTLGLRINVNLCTGLGAALFAYIYRFF